MTREEIRDAVLRALAGIAPEADLARLDADAPIRDQLDVDSIDFMRFLIAVTEQLHVEIPESEYPRVATVNGCVAYLASHLPQAGSADPGRRG
jgi:acyl carrier protein